VKQTAWLRERVLRAVAASEPTLNQRLGRGTLGLAALGYGAAMGMRNAGYTLGVLPVHRLPCRVVCVGNLTVGGTGKTPTVAAVAERLLAAGRKVCVLLRGYGRTGTAAEIVSDGRDLLLEWQDAGDEAILLGRLLPGIPVVVGGDRVEAGELAVRCFGPDILLLDDGFQHRRLHRDVDLVLLDGTDPFGGGRLLPRGRLREPVVALRRAHAILVTRADQVGDLASLRCRLEVCAPGVPVAFAVHQPRRLVDLRSGRPMPLEALRGMKVLAVSGIAKPEGFLWTLRQLRAAPAGVLAFPDHHPFTREDRSRMGREAQRVGAECIVTTEKDAVRLGQELPAGTPTLALGVAITLIEGEEIVRRLLGIASGEIGRG
jgi:tetraacyldisaccharide 4'-kinase